MKITHEKLNELLLVASDNAKVFVPQKIDGTTNFHLIAEDAKIDLDTVRTKTPPKEIIFPQTEKILTTRSTAGKILEIREAAEVENTVIFGVRPCDARGFMLLDNFFMDTKRKDGGEQKHVDPQWIKHREKTLIFSVACTKPLSTCSCTSLGVQPADEKGSDLLFIPDIGGYTVMQVSEKGKKFLADNKSFFTDEGNPAAAQAEANKKCESMISFKIPTENAGKLMGLYKKTDVWEEVSMGCITCGVCTLLCPTCHCFETREIKTRPDESEKIKCWDSCSFCTYSLEASGHNPRPTTADRFKNRILDKFEYHMTLYGEIACTGCGRCTDLCPAGISLADTLASLGGAL
ncbi:MAG: 4Fe-4S dicluster domain-containing protein [Caldisericia bacterium]